MAPYLKPVAATVNLTEQVRDQLMSAIAEGRLASGSLHSVSALANELGVSRTPVREAMLQLAQRGLVRMVRNQGVVILGPSVEDLRQIFQIRLWLEVPATREAARKADEADKRRLWEHYENMRRFANDGDAPGLEREDRMLHTSILELSGNERLARVVNEMRDFTIARGSTTTFRSRTPEEIVTQHLPIIRAIDSNDPDAAGSAMAQHLEASASALLAQEAARQVESDSSSENRRSNSSAT